MKKIIITFVLSLIFSLTSNAQINVGVRGSLPATINEFNIDSIKLESSQPFNIGVVTEILIPGVGFGVEVSGLFELSRVTITEVSKVINSGYILMPINAKWKVGFSGFKVFAFAGPQLGVKLYDDEVVKLDESYLQINRDVEFEPKPITWSFNAGAGVELFKKFQIGFTYYYDFESKYRPIQNIESDAFKKHSGYKITASIFF